MPSHANPLDKRWVDSLVDGNLIQKEGEPLTTLILDSHLVSPGTQKTTESGYQVSIP